MNLGKKMRKYDEIFNVELLLDKLERISEEQAIKYLQSSIQFYEGMTNKDNNIIKHLIKVLRSTLTRMEEKNETK